MVDSINLSLLVVAPATQTLEVVLSMNNHMEMTGPGQSVTINCTHQPAQPTIRIFEPQNGEKVSTQFNAKLNWTGIYTACDLFGKELIPGYGLLFIDSMGNMADRRVSAR